MAPPLLRLEGVSKKFGGLAATRNVSFAVDEGEIVGIIGPNGAGKTTLFNLITGYLQPDSGTIDYAGQSIAGLRPDQINRAGIARTFQILKPFPRMTVEENVMVGALRRCRGDLKRAAAEAGRCIDLVGLGAKRHALGRELSTGQRKRLEMARAMATNPRLLLLDEITGGVDQPSIGGLIALVADLRREGVTLIVIEHNMRVIMSLAERVVFLHLGEKLAEGQPRTVATDPKVVSLYLGGHDA